MTREEAIKVLGAELKERSDGYYDYLQHYGHKDKAEETHLDALVMAIVALGEQEERSKGCGHCLSEINKSMMLAHGFACCTDCGRRLEEV